MPNTIRTADAKAAASAYAPSPGGSSLTYGFIAVSLLVLGLTIFSAFYSVDLLVYPAVLSAAVLVAFVGGMVLRRFRRRRHKQAFAAEYASRTAPVAPTP